MSNSIHNTRDINARSAAVGTTAVGDSPPLSCPMAAPAPTPSPALAPAPAPAPAPATGGVGTALCAWWAVDGGTRDPHQPAVGRATAAVRRGDDEEEEEEEEETDDNDDEGTGMAGMGGEDGARGRLRPVMAGGVLRRRVARRRAGVCMAAAVDVDPATPAPAPAPAAATAEAGRAEGEWKPAEAAAEADEDTANDDEAGEGEGEGEEVEEDVVGKQRGRWEVNVVDVPLAPPTDAMVVVVVVAVSRPVLVEVVAAARFKQPAEDVGGRVVVALGDSAMRVIVGAIRRLLRGEEEEEEEGAGAARVRLLHTTGASRFVFAPPARSSFPHRMPPPLPLPHMLAASISTAGAPLRTVGSAW